MVGRSAGEARSSTREDESLIRTSPIWMPKDSWQSNNFQETASNESIWMLGLRMDCHAGSVNGEGTLWIVFLYEKDITIVSQTVTRYNWVLNTDL